MIVDIEEDLRDFVTIYKRDYLRRRTERSSGYRPLPNYPPPLNILNGPYEQRLNTRRRNLSLPENEQSEDPVDNLSRIRDKFPHLKNALPRVVPNEDVIEHEEEKSRKTMYQVDYSKEFDQYFRSRSDQFGKKVTLPRDWIIPETIQRFAYRNPWIIATRDLIKPPTILKPCNNLDPNPKERKILRITTGDSEYVRTIGATAKRIVLQTSSDTKEHFRLQTPLRSPEISESECLSILKQNLALPSKIF